MNHTTSGEQSTRKFPWTIRTLGRVAYRCVQLFVLLVCLWTVGAIRYCPGLPSWLGRLLAWGYLLGVPCLLYRSDKPWETVRIPLAIALLAMLMQPWTVASNDRPWAADQAILPWAEIEDNRVTIENVRNMTYTDSEHFVVQYSDRTFNVDQVDSIWFGVQEFSSFQGLAHTFLTFGFRNEDALKYVSVSVEIRKEKGEVFSPVSALYRQFELMYVVGEERDLLGQRAIEREDVVYLYPMRASQQQMKQMFLDVAGRMNGLADHPEFYHTFTSNCTNNLVYHLNRLTPGIVRPSSLGIIFPGYSDRVAFNLGLIDTEQGFRETKQRYRVDQLAREIGDVNNFSSRLREKIQQR